MCSSGSAFVLAFLWIGLLAILRRHCPVLGLSLHNAGQHSNTCNCCILFYHAAAAENQYCFRTNLQDIFNHSPSKNVVDFINNVNLHDKL